MTTSTKGKGRCFSTIIPSNPWSLTTATKCWHQLTPRGLSTYGTSRRVSCWEKSINKAPSTPYAGESTRPISSWDTSKPLSYTESDPATSSNSTSAATYNTYRQSLSHRLTYIVYRITVPSLLSTIQLLSCFQPLSRNKTLYLVLEFTTITLPGSFQSFLSPLKRKSHNLTSMPWRQNNTRLKMAIFKTVLPEESTCTFVSKASMENIESASCRRARKKLSSIPVFNLHSNICSFPEKETS